MSKIVYLPDQMVILRGECGRVDTKQRVEGSNIGVSGVFHINTVAITHGVPLIG